MRPRNRPNPIDTNISRSRSTSPRRVTRSLRKSDTTQVTGPIHANETRQVTGPIHANETTRVTGPRKYETTQVTKPRKSDTKQVTWSLDKNETKQVNPMHEETPPAKLNLVLSASGVFVEPKTPPGPPPYLKSKIKRPMIRNVFNKLL